MSKTKTYWKGYDEKHQTPEFAVSSKKEFKEDVPVDEFLSTDGLEDMKTGRRDFLKYMGFSVAAATLASCESRLLNLFHMLISQKKSHLGLLTGIQVLTMMEMILLIY